MTSSPAALCARGTANWPGPLEIPGGDTHEFLANFEALSDVGQTSSNRIQIGINRRFSQDLGEQRKHRDFITWKDSG